MIEKIPSFHLIYRSTFSVIWLPSNEGITSITPAPVLSNLNKCLDIFDCTLLFIHIETVFLVLSKMFKIIKLVSADLCALVHIQGKCIHEYMSSMSGVSSPSFHLSSS